MRPEGFNICYLLPMHTPSHWGFFMAKEASFGSAFRLACRSQDTGL